MLFPAFIVHMAVVVIGCGATFSGFGSSGAGLEATSPSGGRPSQPGDGQVSSIDYQVSGVSDHASGISDQVSGARDQASGISDQASGTRDHASGTRDQASGNRDQASGISGTVYRLSGNHMPAPNRHPHPSGRPRSAVDSGRTSGAHTSGADSSGAGARSGVKATVCIFPLTSDNQVVRTGGGSSPYYKAVLTHLIRQVDTDDKGYFQVALPPGTYSVFTKNGDLFYATQRDEKNNIAPVKVLPGEITRIQCSVESDHKVVY